MPPYAPAQVVVWSGFLLALLAAAAFLGAAARALGRRVGAEPSWGLIGTLVLTGLWATVIVYSVN